MIFYFVPQRGTAQTLLDNFGNRQLRTIDFRAVSDIFENRFREWIWPLKDHANSAAQLSNILRKNVLPVEEDFALQSCVTHGFVHAIEGAQQRGFAAA